MENLILETQQSYYGYIKKVENGAIMISEQILSGQLDIALKGIADFSEGLAWLVSVELLMIENGYYIESATMKVQTYLKEINEALNREDYTYIADLFKYEIAPSFEVAELWEFVKTN